MIETPNLLEKYLDDLKAGNALGSPKYMSTDSITDTAHGKYDYLDLSNSSVYPSVTGVSTITKRSQWVSILGTLSL